MFKQNMAPYLADSNNINKLPKTNDILNSIFGKPRIIFSKRL